MNREQIIGERIFKTMIVIFLLLSIFYIVVAIYLHSTKAFIGIFIHIFISFYFYKKLKQYNEVFKTIKE